MILNKYNLLSRLGGGCFGSTVLLESPAQNKNIIIKIFPKKLASTRLSTRLSIIQQTIEQDINLFPMAEMIKDEHFYYLLSELFEPEEQPLSLTQCLAQRKNALTELEIAGILNEALKGLENLHRFGYPHLNIKPNNLVVNNQTLQIADWGLQEIYLHFRKFTNRYEKGVENDLPISNNTKEVVLASVQSDLFASPEVRKDTSKGLSADIYSMGILSLYLFTGSTNLRTHSVTKLHPEKNPEWDEFISKACHSNPKKRYRSAQEMRENIPLPNDSFDASILTP